MRARFKCVCMVCHVKKEKNRFHLYHTNISYNFQMLLCRVMCMSILVPVAITCMSHLSDSCAL